MPYCENCGRFVSKSFIRVFGDNGRVATCMNCNDQRDLSNGEGIPDDQR